jgi:Tol biopolymer transport system component
LAAWAPGRKIIFTRGLSFDYGAGSATGLYIINADGTGRRLVRRTSAYIPTSIGGWSPDDKLILYSTRQGISTWRLSDGSVRRLRRGGSDSYPTWGPHGGRIAFARNTPHGNGIFIMNRDGTHGPLAVIGPIPHTFGWNRYFTLTWAPR